MTSALTTERVKQEDIEEALASLELAQEIDEEDEGVTRVEEEDEDAELEVFEEADEKRAVEGFEEVDEDGEPENPKGKEPHENACPRRDDQ